MGWDSGGDYIWVHILAKKMDDETRKHWELYSTGDAPQRMTEMTQFLEERARALDFSSNSASNSRVIKDKFEKRQSHVYQAKAESTAKCGYCDQNHLIYKYDAFKSLSHDDKVNTIQEKQLCFNCFPSGHTSRDCKSKFGCRKCKKNGITLCYLIVRLK